MISRKIVKSNASRVQPSHAATRPSHSSLVGSFHHGMLFPVLTDVTEPLWRDVAGSTRLLEVRFGRPGRALNRSTWAPVKGSSASVSSNRLGYGCPTRILWIPATDTDIISAQHFWTG